jgi:hypothetical protein
MNAMTLEQVRDWHRHQLNFLPESGVPTDLHQNAADAIDAHLAQPAQATTCAGCGEHKATPLRIDAMGGYVCLTCIDQKLSSLLGEFGYPEPQPTQAVDVAALQKGFMTAESCGPDGHYVLKIKFQSLADLQAAHNTLARALTGEKAGPVDGLSSETFGGWCNTLTHAYMYVTERSWGNAHYGIEAVLNDLREWQRKLTPPSTSPAPDKECQP